MLWLHPNVAIFGDSTSDLRIQSSPSIILYYRMSALNDICILYTIKIHFMETHKTEKRTTMGIVGVAGFSISRITAKELIK